MPENEIANKRLGLLINFGSALLKDGFDCFKALMDHNTSELLKTLDDAIITGSTGSNVNDLAVCIVLPHA